MRVRRRLSGWLAFAATVALALTGMAGMAGSAMAEEPAERCSGANIEGQGSSLQGVAMEVWGTHFNSSEFAGACNGTQGSKGKPTLKYTSSGSGEGRLVWGAEKKGNKPLAGLKESPEESGDAFVGTDEPLSAEQMESVDEAAGAGVKGKGQALVIPVEQAAVAVIVNPPAECLISKITNKNLQEIWSGVISEWSEVTGGSPEAGVTEDKSGACKVSITRVAREDVSGTTFVFKTYLNEVLKGAATCSGKTWAEYLTVAENTKWPEPGVGTCKGLKVVFPAAKGGKEEVEKVKKEADSIGYANLADARKGYTEDGGSYHWLGVQNESKEKFYPFPGTSAGEPSLETGESHCEKTHYENLPAKAEADANWSKVNGAHPKGNENYPICTLTYDVALVNYELAQFTTPNSVATTAYDFLNHVVAKEGGQTDIVSHDYRQVEEAVGKLAKEEAQLIGGGTIVKELSSAGTEIELEAFGGVNVKLDFLFENVGPGVWKPTMVLVPKGGAFNIVVDECTGKMIAVGATCLVEVESLVASKLEWLTDAKLLTPIHLED